MLFFVVAVSFFSSGEMGRGSADSLSGSLLLGPEHIKEGESKEKNLRVIGVCGKVGRWRAAQPSEVSWFR